MTKKRMGTYKHTKIPTDIVYGADEVTNSILLNARRWGRGGWGEEEEAEGSNPKKFSKVRWVHSISFMAL